MDLLAAYDSDCDTDENAAPSTPGIGGESTGDRAAAQQHHVETAGLDQAPQRKRARLNDRAGSSKALGAAAAGQAASGTQAALPARVRCFPLVQGLFPTMVYVPVPEAAAQQLQALAAQLVAAVAAAGLASHLSQTVPIRYGQAASLTAALQKQLKPYRRFKVQLSGLVCLTNEPKTRTFVCLRVAEGLQQVLRMIRQVDAAFTLHGLPQFHENPVPHVSLAWAPGDQTQVLQRWLDSFQHLPVAFAVSHVQCQERSTYADFKRLATSYASAQACIPSGAAFSWPRMAVALELEQAL
ncbi:hypothetical protein OEZ85_014099 [Tetradesmus obliquus]|uniref:U6 snRNA phosphodiesterase 1 n=1 Tax=Tetradesmus obliquus TaxID=3088 RepID=A0ABY8U7B0_TETOB|nr:hypothetical protein OEZ85_014099 [Tetradesmus obliquus]